MATGSVNGVYILKNITFDRSSGPIYPGIITADGQLLIGSIGSFPDIAMSAGALISTTLAIGYTFPNITIETIGGNPPAETLTGNDGIPIATVAGNWNIVTANATTKFIGTEPTLLLDFGLTNLILGSSPSSIGTGDNNTGVGSGTLLALTDGQSNSAFGVNCLRALTTGSNNCGYGVATLRNVTSSSNNTAYGLNALNLLTTGTGGNTAYGYQSLNQILTGFYNTGIGYQAGHNLNGTENNNIYLGANVTGTAGENNVTRIGSNQSKCIVDGIEDVDLSVVKMVTINLDQLGSTTLIEGAGVKFTIASNTVTIDVPKYSNQGSSTTVQPNSGSFVTATETLTTPLTADLSDGDLLEFVVTNGILTIQLNAGQTAQIGDTISTSAGTLQNTAIGDTIILRWQNSASKWWATSVIGIWSAS